MTVQETAELIRDIRIMFREQFTRLSDNGDQCELVKIWAAALREYTGEEVRMAFMEYVRSPGTHFPPKPGDLIRLIERSRPGRAPDKFTAWDMVRGLLGSRRLDEDPQAAFDSLPKAVRMGVGSPAQLLRWNRETDSEMPFIERGFMERYALALEDPPTEFDPPRLRAPEPQRKSRRGEGECPQEFIDELINEALRRINPKMYDERVREKAGSGNVGDGTEGIGK